MKYNLSIYTSRIVVNSNIYLYNAFTDKLMALSKEIDELINQHKKDIILIKDIHPTLFDALAQGGFVINDNINEWERVLSKWEKEDSSTEKFTMTINPTLDCNMRCWYCYEQHNQSAYMSDKTLQSILRLIEHKVNMRELQGLNIDFFGGEPLLCYDRCIKPILEKAYAECLRTDKMLYISFTTNGFLLSPSVVDELNRYAKWGQVRMQITLDGNEPLHNKVKSADGVLPSYKNIVSNICYCVKHNIKVLVRFNYTRKNIDSFYDVIEVFEGLTTEERKNMSFTMHRVWQESKTDDLENREKKLREALIEAGFHVENNEPLKGTRCYADRRNYIVINYNGDLYKCTARAFVPNSREGILTEDGELVWNERFWKRMELNKCSDVCHKCSIYPICHAGCTQNKIEMRQNSNVCPLKHTEEDKVRILEKKIAYRIKG